MLPWELDEVAQGDRPAGELVLGLPVKRKPEGKRLGPLAPASCSQKRLLS